MNDGVLDNDGSGSDKKIMRHDGHRIGRLSPGRLGHGHHRQEGHRRNLPNSRVHLQLDLFPVRDAIQGSQSDCHKATQYEGRDQRQIPRAQEQ